MDFTLNHVILLLLFIRETKEISLKRERIQIYAAISLIQ